MRYTKPALTFEEQLTLLIDRGLAVTDAGRVRHWLQKVSYYHLSAYFLPFKQGEMFTPGTTFDDIAGLYIFDRKLRLLILDAIERIEIAVRTAITYEIAHAYGPFGHTAASNFAPQLDHVRFMADLAVEEGRALRGRETFAVHFRNKYTAQPHLPVWMATELLSFGAMSQLYEALAPPIKSKIAASYGVNHEFFASWLHALSYTRNICAHHKRLWNRQFAIKPRLPSRSRQWAHTVPDNGRLYCVLVLLQHLLRVVSPQCHWRDRVFEFFDKHPSVSLSVMQFPQNWRGLALWR